MPRQKRSSRVSKQKLTKRWCSEHYSHGVGCVIDLLTGFVMDFEIMSKRCIECEHAKSGLGENSAEFHVCISSDQKPQHFKCLTGKDSWCFFQAALVRGEVPGPHVKHVKTPLRETHLAKIMPLYQRLASNKLLQRCIRCVTQNANESLHSIIWGKCSKETSATLRRVTIAVCEFNFGTKKSLENLQKENGLASNKQSKMLAVWRDYRRVYQRKRKRLAVQQRGINNAKSVMKRHQILRCNECLVMSEGCVNETRNFDPRQVTRMTSELAAPYPNYHSNGRALKLDRFNVHRYLCTVDLQWP
ncbi:uncharacterized protein TNCV_383941 [Trichonephila clavipes]|nr:uncharacterized protein TNCV_383941 [Trichonephila clavipes]